MNGTLVSNRLAEIENKIVGENDFIDWKKAGLIINRVILAQLDINLKINPLIKLDNRKFERFLKSEKQILNFKTDNKILVCKIGNEIFIINTNDKTYQKLYKGGK